MDGLDLGAIQVTIILPMLQEPASPNVHLHLCPASEVVGVSVQLVVARSPGSVCKEIQLNCQSVVCKAVYIC